MSNFNISEYLKGRDKKNQEISHGISKACLNEVAHKRKNSPAATDEEKRKFAKRPASAFNS